MKRKSFDGAVYECSLKSFLPLGICIIQIICEKEKQMAIFHTIRSSIYTK